MHLTQHLCNFMLTAATSPPYKILFQKTSSEQKSLMFLIVTISCSC